MNWWRQYHDVRFVVNEAQQFTMGNASGHDCNCLIDTLRQQLHLDCDVGAVRAYVQAQHASLVHRDYLELQHHWQDVICGFAHVVGDEFIPSTYKIVCLDATFIV